MGELAALGKPQEPTEALWRAAAAAILGAWLLGALARASWVCWALRREAKASIRLTELTTTRVDHV